MSSLLRKMVLLIAAVLSFSIPAQVQNGFYLSQGIAACYNPLGLILETRYFYRAPLSADTGILWKSTKADIGLLNEWSPADELFGIAVNIEPIAVFDITIKAGLYKIYPLLGFGFRPLEGPAAPVDNASLDRIPAQSRLGSWVSAAPTLKVKLAPVIFSNTVTAVRLDFGDTNRYFAEIRSGMAHRYRDINVTNDLYLLFERDSTVCAGINYNLFYVRSTREMQQKLGGIIIATPVYKKNTRVYGVLSGGMYLQSRLYDGSFYVAAAAGIEAKAPRFVRVIRKQAQ